MVHFECHKNPEKGLKNGLQIIMKLRDPVATGMAKEYPNEYNTMMSPGLGLEQRVVHLVLCDSNHFRLHLGLLTSERFRIRSNS